MKFTEEKAAAIAKKFSLAESTIAVWKTRGNIPDRYFKDDYKKSDKIKSRVQDKLLSILRSEKLNLVAFANRSGVAHVKVRDVLAEKSSFFEHEFTAMKVALNTIRVDAKKHVEAFRKGRLTDREAESFKKFLNDNPELVIMKIFKEHKLIDWRNGKPVAMRPDDYRKAVDNLAVFILETALPASA